MIGVDVDMVGVDVDGGRRREVLVVVIVGFDVDTNIVGRARSHFRGQQTAGRFNVSHNVLSVSMLRVA